MKKDSLLKRAAVRVVQEEHGVFLSDLGLVFKERHENIHSFTAFVCYSVNQPFRER